MIYLACTLNFQYLSRYCATVAHPTPTQKAVPCNQIMRLDAVVQARRGSMDPAGAAVLGDVLVHIAGHKIPAVHLGWVEPPKVDVHWKPPVSKKISAQFERTGFLMCPLDYNINPSPRPKVD